MNSQAEVQSNANQQSFESNKHQQQQLEPQKQTSISFLSSFNSTMNKIEQYMVVLKVHGGEAIQVWSSEPFKRTSSISSSSAASYVLDAWSSCSSLSNRSLTTTVNSAAPSRASTICSEDETDEDYFSGTDGSASSSISGSGPAPSIRYSLTQLSGHSQASSADKLELIVLEQPSKEMNSCNFHAQSSQGQAFKSSDMVIYRSKPVEGRQNTLFEVNLSYGSASNKIGKACISFDPRRSTQGTARSQIMDCNNETQIGQLQFDYLIITNPIAFGTNSPQPKWLSKVAQLDAGHRGAGSGCRADIPGSIVENTVASFNYAARHGADMCELDVFVSADGVPVVYHDFDVDIGRSQKIQVNEYTLEQLRDFECLYIHNDDRDFTLDVQGQAETNRPFPTLEEVLKGVDKSCALNIEIKWPQLLENGKLQGLRNREVNDFVDRILGCISSHHNGRPIILSTFDADIAIMLRMKQIEFPVLFLTTGDSQRFTDPRTKTVKNGIHFAQAFDLAGINPRSDHITQYLVRYAKQRGLLVYSWGNDINSAQVIRELKRIGLNGVIYDKIDLIKPKD